MSMYIGMCVHVGRFVLNLPVNQLDDISLVKQLHLAKLAIIFIYILTVQADSKYSK